MLGRIVSALTPDKARQRIILWSILLLLALILPLAACAGAMSAPPSGDGTTPIPAPTLTLTLSSSASAAFQVDELVIAPAVAELGEGIVITAQVTNTGEADGSYTTELKINDIAEEAKKATIPAGETYTLRFSEAKTIPGTYSVGLGELTGQFVVIEPTELVQAEYPEATEIESDIPSCCGGSSDSTEPDTSSGCGCGCSGRCGDR